MNPPPVGKYFSAIVDHAMGFRWGDRVLIVQVVNKRCARFGDHVYSVQVLDQEGRTCWLNPYNFVSNRETTPWSIAAEDFHSCFQPTEEFMKEHPEVDR
jgi:hypothetical protein